MELKDYLKILAKSWLLILTTTIIFGGLGYIKTKRIKPSTQAFVTFQVSQKPEAGTNFKFENFYNLSALPVLIDQISAPVLSPNTIIDIYQKAGIELPSNDPRKLTKAFKIQKPSGGASVTTFIATDNDSQTAVKLAQTLKSEILTRFYDQQKNNQLSDSFSISASNIASLTTRPNSIFNAIIFAVVGLLVGSAGVLLKNYLI